jgi:ribose 5-phosphate isomerase B
MTGPVIALAADHAGFELKNNMKAVLDQQSVPLVDLGPETADPVDYPDMAGKLSAALEDGRAQQGLLVCGTGIGIAIAANRYPWIRAAVCHDVTAARLAREHNDANVLALGARLIGPEVARDCLLTFLQTPFSGGRHARRVAKMSSLVPLRAPGQKYAPAFAQNSSSAFLARWSVVPTTNLVARSTGMMLKWTCSR